MIGKTIHELKIGDTAEFGKTVTESDIYLSKDVDIVQKFGAGKYVKKPYISKKIVVAYIPAISKGGKSCYRKCF